MQPGRVSMHRYAGLRYGALDGVRVTLAEVFQHADGTLDGDAYMLIRELVATGERSMIAPVRAALERYTADRNWYGRDLMAHLLAGLAGTEAFPLLLDLYADAMRRDDGDDWDFLGRALCTAMRADPAACRAVILPLVTGDDQHVRRAALWAIGYVFEPSDMAMLREALADPEPWIRFTALGSLPSVKDNPEIYDVLVATLRDPDQWVQREAVLLLAWSAPSKIVDHLIPLISEPAFYARSALGEAIGRRAANSDRIPAAAAALRQLLADPEPSVRTGAVRGIGLLGEPLDALESMVDDPDWQVRSAVADVSRST
jgi:HEAT repeat protein